MLAERQSRAVGLPPTFRTVAIAASYKSRVSYSVPCSPSSSLGLSKLIMTTVHAPATGFWLALVVTLKYYYAAALCVLRYDWRTRSFCPIPRSRVQPNASPTRDLHYSNVAPGLDSFLPRVAFARPRVVAEVNLYVSVPGLA